MRPWKHLTEHQFGPFLYCLLLFGFSQFLQVVYPCLRGSTRSNRAEQSKSTCLEVKQWNFTVAGLEVLSILFQQSQTNMIYRLYLGLWVYLWNSLISFCDFARSSKMLKPFPYNLQTTAVVENNSSLVQMHADASMFFCRFDLAKDTAKTFFEKQQIEKNLGMGRVFEFCPR